jgi:hypothetical protein
MRKKQIGEKYKNAERKETNRQPYEHQVQMWQQSRIQLFVMNFGEKLT